VVGAIHQLAAVTDPQALPDPSARRRRAILTAAMHGVGRPKRILFASTASLLGGASEACSI
jgi:hypothetical protein